MATYQNIDEFIDKQAAAAYEEIERKAARDQKRKEERIKQENDGTTMDFGPMDFEPTVKKENPPEFRRPSFDGMAIRSRPTSSNGSASNHGGPARPSREDRYSSERAENNERRNRRVDDANAGRSDNDSANGSVRSKIRSRSPRRDHRRNDRSRERQPRDSYHSSGRPRVDDSYRPGDRGSSGRQRRSSRSPGRGRYDDDYRGGYGRRGGRDGFDDRFRDGGRGGGGGGGRRRSPQPAQPTEDERDKRTVFVQQLAARLRTKQLKEFFEQAGPVADAQIVKDRVSQRSKGVGYVEFKDEESVQKAIQMTGQKLCGIPIIAQLTEAEKNRQARNTEGQPTQSNGIPFHRLYVGNIHFSITEEDLRSVFAPFGELEFVQLQKEDAGRSKGYGFVQFINPTEAKDALDKMNGFELAGRPIRVGLGNDKFTPESTTALLQRFGNQNAQNPQGSSFSGMGGRGAHAGGASSFDRPAAARDADKTGGASALDDTDVGGVNFSNYSRESLMRKLARTDEPEQKIAPKTHQKQPAVVQPTASRCVLIKNVYDQATETEPGWQKELEVEMRDECDDKYGKVVHLGLALDNNDGEVYVKFDRVQGGENAVKGLNGRWFGGRQLTASYVVDAVYSMIFPKAPN